MYMSENPPYSGLPNHEMIKHTVGKCVRGAANMSALKWFQVMLTWGHMGTFRNICSKHLPKYANNFSGQHNSRPLSTVDQIEETAFGVVRKTFKYRELTL